MRIGIIGTGYVGLSAAVGFALKDHQVKCFDIDNAKLEAINKRQSPIFEAQMQDSLAKVVPLKLGTVSSLNELLDFSEVVFVCVGTPTLDNGKQDLTAMNEVIKQIGFYLKNCREFKTIVIKSTVLPGTTENTIKASLEIHGGKRSGVDFGLAFNPEFLREGYALHDFLNPDRIVIGCNDQLTCKILSQIYLDFKSPIVVTSFAAAEMIKYASNAFLATKISFINEIGAICKANEINVYDVADGIGMDKRIGRQFLDAGLGWGGSCLPKDSAALIHLAKRNGIKPSLIEAAVEVNQMQPYVVLKWLKQNISKGSWIALLGLTFKSGTDDVRDSQSIKLYELLKKDYKVILYDPQGRENFFKELRENSVNLFFASTAQVAVDKADAVIVATGWKEFAALNYGEKPVIDCRNIIIKEKRGVNYRGLYW